MAAAVRPLALTQGDPSGIGPELALQAWAALRGEPGAAFFYLGDPAHLAALAQRLDLDVPIEEAGPADAGTVFSRALPVLPTNHRVRGEAGRPVPEDAAGTIAAIERAVTLVRDGAAAAVVTNPIAKYVLHKAGFEHPGHTEFLGALALRDFGVAARPVMLLYSETLAVVPITIHIPLIEVASRLSQALIVETGRIVARDLASRFGIERPRLAFSGLNPHAGEGGDMGREEIDVIAPAVAVLAAEIDASGPHPADTMFHAAARARYDVALTMYHDQALIPVKTLAFDSAVNVTLGLPFVRASPDHGTAFDIAGAGRADPSSLLAALRLAARLASACPAA